jgi:hypothetical protein
LHGASRFRTGLELNADWAGFSAGCSWAGCYAGSWAGSWAGLARVRALSPHDAEFGERDEGHRVSGLHAHHIFRDVDEPVGGAQARYET